MAILGYATRHELALFCIFALGGARPETRGAEQGRPVPPGRLGSFCALVPRPGPPGLVPPDPGGQIGFVLRISRPARLRSGKIGFVLQERHLGRRLSIRNPQLPIRNSGAPDPQIGFVLRISLPDRPPPRFPSLPKFGFVLHNFPRPTSLAEIGFVLHK
jgi:hypothetical protein